MKVPGPCVRVGDVDLKQAFGDHKSFMVVQSDEEVEAVLGSYSADFHENQIERAPAEGIFGSLAGLCRKLRETGGSGIKKSNVGGFHSRIYRFGSGGSEGGVAAEIDAIIEGKIRRCVTRFHEEQRSRIGKGKGVFREYHQAQWWVNIMDASEVCEEEGEEEGQQTETDSFKEMPLSVYRNGTDIYRAGGVAGENDNRHSGHDHNGATYSGVMYVDTLGSTSLLHLHFGIGDEGELFCLPLQCPTGHIYVFHGHTLHAVSPHRGRRDRISIAFNYFVGTGGGGYAPAIK